MTSEVTCSEREKSFKSFQKYIKLSLLQPFCRFLINYFKRSNIIFPFKSKEGKVCFDSYSVSTLLRTLNKFFFC